MIKIIPREEIKHLELQPGQGRVQEVNPATSPIAQPQNISFPNLPAESFIFSYDGTHKDFFQELIMKTNAVYSGTGAEIPTGTSGAIQGNLIKRMALVSTIANDSSLRSANLYPITLIQSEYLLKEGRLKNLRRSWEDFGMVLYDRSHNGKNPKEAQAIYDSLKVHRQDLGLSESDLENRLIIINPGAEIYPNMPHEVRPIIIPGITQVYQHEVFKKVGEGKDISFHGYGLNGGLPLLNQLESGDRTLSMPDETEDIGLRVLHCERGINLGVNIDDFVDLDTIGHINFAQSAST